jgi:hypothetical protein
VCWLLSVALGLSLLTGAGTLVQVVLVGHSYVAGSGPRDDVTRLLQELPLGSYNNVEQVFRSVRINASASEG